jgi:hypothetical protein
LDIAAGNRAALTLEKLRKIDRLSRAQYKISDLDLALKKSVVALSNGKEYYKAALVVGNTAKGKNERPKNKIGMLFANTVLSPDLDISQYDIKFWNGKTAKIKDIEKQTIYEVGHSFTFFKTEALIDYVDDFDNISHYITLDFSPKDFFCIERRCVPSSQAALRYRPDIMPDVFKASNFFLSRQKDYGEPLFFSRKNQNGSYSLIPLATNIYSPCGKCDLIKEIKYYSPWYLSIYVEFIQSLFKF